LRSLGLLHPRLPLFGSYGARPLSGTGKRCCPAFANALQSARRRLDNGRGSEQGALAGWDGLRGVQPCVSDRLMLTMVKRSLDVKPPAQFQDPALGLLVSRHSDVWCADLPFQDGSVSLLVPGSHQQPDADRLAYARLTIPSLPELARAAREFAVQKRPELSNKRLVFDALNFFGGAAFNDFSLDFTEVGDDSGNSWQVHFRSGQPIELDYT
jgi:hypothetical protein